jgi:flagellar motor protein MotB
VPKISDHPSPWTVVNDYTKTVVTLASALLAFTGTFSTSDRMAAGPRCPLFLSWIALSIAIAAALYSAGQLTRVLKSGKGAYCCLLCANISYFALFAGIILFLIFAVLATEKQTIPPPPVAATAAAGSIELVEVGDTIPAFASGSATETSSEFAQAICKARQKLKELGSATAIVVGHHDREELTKTSAGRFASNIGLAQQRADWVAQMLQTEGACDASPVKHVLAVIGGPRKTDPNIRAKGAALHAALADDRRVEIEALRYVPETAKPTPENHTANSK